MPRQGAYTQLAILPWRCISSAQHALHQVQLEPPRQLHRAACHVEECQPSHGMHDLAMGHASEKLLTPQPHAAMAATRVTLQACWAGATRTT
jgi:hypothetical protein